MNTTVGQQIRIDSGELSPGVLLHNGRYKILMTLGKGGFGVTYLAEQVDTREIVCIKEFFPSAYYRRTSDNKSLILKDMDNATMMNRFKYKFIKEAKTIASMSHPNIVRVFNDFEENETAYYVMEYIDGESLQAKISRGALDVNVALDYTNKVADALAYIHGKNTLHLDIKPQNVMIRDDDRVVVIDFGLAKHYDEDSGAETTTTLGGFSDGYAPIEQYAGGSISMFTPETDIYSLGATLYTMVVGMRPPRANELVHKDALVVPASLPYGIRTAIECSMRYDVTMRPHSIVEFKNLLCAELKPKSKSKPWFLVPLFVILLGFVAYIFLSDRKESQIDVPETVVVSDGFDDDVIEDEEPSVIEEPPTSILIPNLETEEVDNRLKTKRYSYSVITACGLESTLVLDYPIGENTALVNNVQEWIVEQIAFGYKGDISDADAVVAYCKNCDINDDTGSASIELTVVYENDKIVTYQRDYTYYGNGAATALWNTDGASFRKSDGKRFTSSSMRYAIYELQPLIKQKLKQYFDVNTDEELEGHLQLSEPYSISYIPLPEYNNPWITADGIEFYYSKYEIAAGVFLPHFTLTLSEMRNYLTESTINSFF